MIANIGGGWAEATHFVMHWRPLMGFQSMERPLILLPQVKYWNGQGSGRIGSTMKDVCKQQTRCGELE